MTLVNGHYFDLAPVVFKIIHSFIHFKPLEVTLALLQKAGT